MGPKEKISKLSNNSLGTLTERIINNIDASTVAELKTAECYSLCVQVYEQYKNATTKKEKQKTDDIDIAFQNRRFILAEMRKYTQGLQISPDEDMKTAANRLFAEINRFGWDFANLKSADQSHNYSLIIAGLKKPELTADLQALKLTEKVAQLEQAHRSYEECYMQWRNYKKTATTASQLRNQLELALKNLIDELGWLLRKTPTEAIKELHTCIHARIEELNLSKSKEKADETPDTSTRTGNAA